ncbi:MAG: magnesium transporter CorA family protein [Elusimicrobium sp.]|jgi:magnesium transporter|nr:magnesium transporter CorA family protein [Elusimicrobium sp.]
MEKKYIFENNKLVETETENAAVYVYTAPDAQEQKFIVNNFDIDEHTLASSLDPEEIARLEFGASHAAMIFKRPKNYSSKEQLEFKVASMGMFLYEHKLLLVLSEDIPLFVGKHFNSAGCAQDVFLKIIYNAIAHYLEHLRVITSISEEIEDKMTESTDNKYLLNLLSLEKSLVYYVNAITSNGFVFNRALSLSQKLWLNEDQKEILEDIIVENNQCQKQAEIGYDILALLIEARANVINNNLNILIKKLTAITICLMLPSFIVSLFSMNVSIPLAGHPYAFMIICFIAALSVVSIILFWKYKKW